MFTFFPKTNEINETVKPFHFDHLLRKHLQNYDNGFTCRKYNMLISMTEAIQQFVH